MSFSTPNSYLEEHTIQPVTINSGATALPVFVGYTRKAIDAHGNNLTNMLTPIGSLLDYEAYFGAAEVTGLDVHIDVDGHVLNVAGADTRHYLHQSIDLYFRNGGTTCYILSVGNYSGPMVLEDFDNAIAVLENEAAPTLVILTDAVNLSSADYYTLCNSVLAQCSELMDRFVILDVKDNDVNTFRDGIGNVNLSYGAAYYPYVNTTFDYPYDESRVAVRHGYGLFEIDNCISVAYSGLPADGAAITITEAPAGLADIPDVTVTGNTVKILVNAGTGSPPGAVIEAWKRVSGRGLFDIKVAGTGSVFLSQQAAEFVFDGELAKLGDGRIKIDSPVIYDGVTSALSREKTVLPPSAVVAAAYAKTDIETGPWKAPANIIINDVTGPVRHINNTDQETLNRSQDGKSINGIRSFTNRGTLIWGARTLDGNSNEWRYVPVRRLFIKLESEIRKSTTFCVFEPNNSFTWLKLKTMLIAYLDELWSAGALNGAAAEEAYFVRIGLGETMDEKDILEGRLHISVGVAPVRPAEFIAMTITHILQES